MCLFGSKFCNYIGLEIFLQKMLASTTSEANTTLTDNISIRLIQNMGEATYHETIEHIHIIGNETKH
jgi:hypothetical protein